MTPAKHQLFISMGNDFSKAIRFTAHISALFDEQIAEYDTGEKDGEYGGYFTFKDVRCIPAIFEIAALYYKN